MPSVSFGFFSSKLIRHPQNRFVTSTVEPTQAPGLIHFAAEVGDEEVALRQPQDQTRSEIIVHRPAELRAVVVDRIDHQEGKRQESPLEIDRACRHRPDHFPVAHLIGGCQLTLEARSTYGNVLPKELRGKKKRRAAVQQSDPRRAIKTNERLPGIAFLDAEEATR